MLSLNPFLHALWARGVFALKCLGVAPAPANQGAVVSIQFHWMPMEQKRSTSAHAHAVWNEPVAASDRTAWLRRSETRTCYGLPAVVAVDHADDVEAATTLAAAAAITAPSGQTGRFLQTGHTVRITLPSIQDGLLMKMVLDVQWACIRMASMSGAAGDPEFFVMPDDDDDDGDAFGASAAAADGDSADLDRSPR